MEGQMAKQIRNISVALVTIFSVAAMSNVSNANIFKKIEHAASKEEKKVQRVVVKDAKAVGKEANKIAMNPTIRKGAKKMTDVMSNGYQDAGAALKRIPLAGDGVADIASDAAHAVRTKGGKFGAAVGAAGCVATAGLSCGAAAMAGAATNGMMGDYYSRKVAKAAPKIGQHQRKLDDN
jgi:hypothetical protein